MAIAFMAVLGIGVLSLVCYAFGMTFFLGILLPYAALLVFIAGVIWRITGWARSPVPFPITLTGGQQKALPWIPSSRLEAPASGLEVAGRMVLEVFFFRSLFRNTRAELRLDDAGEARLVYWSSKWLWVFALMFHYALGIILIRHGRFIVEPIPFCLQAAAFLDSLMQLGSPAFFLSDAAIVAGLAFLFLRRLTDPKLRYISLSTDYFPLFLLLAVALSGLCLRYVTPVDITAVKVLAMGLVTLSPAIPPDIGPAFYLHLAFAAALLMYFPFSKLMHAAGVFLSPTRNLPANSRAFSYKNPWNGPKVYRTYAEYEDEFRDAMAEAGLPLEKKPDAASAK